VGLVVCLFLSELVAGCSGERRVGGGGPVIDTLPSGVVRVSNRTGGSWSQGEEWRVREEFRLGSIDAQGPELFGRIQYLAVDGAGRIWVFDGQDSELRVFGAFGAFVQSIGGRGGGPGEFSQAAGLAWAPDGRLWVPDPGNNRVSVFDTAGALSASRPTDLRFQYFPWGGTIDQEGFFYKEVRTAPFPSPEFGLARYDSALNPVDTIPGPTHPEGPRVWTRQEESGGTVIRIPFSGRVAWKLTRDGGIWSVLTDEYRLVRLDRNSDTVRVVEKAHDPIPVTGTELDSAMASLAHFGDTPKRSDVPSTKPPVLDFVVDDEGNLWVFVLAEGLEDGQKVEVFDGDGIYLGELILHFRTRIYPHTVIRGNTMTAVTTDSLGVNYVVRASIEKPGEG
jgi:sugar lactone lactonase YvrE